MKVFIYLIDSKELRH